MKWIKERNLGAKILIVDDSAASVELLETMLEMAGYHYVKSTTDPRKVESLHQQENFDLILLDIQMPHMNGYEVMKKLVAGIKDDYLPILVLTAQHDMQTRLKALELGAKDFVTKPFNSAEVLNRIGNMLEVRELYKQQKEHAELLEKTVEARTKELYARNIQLEVTRYEIVRSLGRAGEYRDNETGFHVLRMSKTCQLIALAAGIDEKQSATILHASPLHDIGKIGIPDNVLLKPGKLNESEWETMKSHVEIGAKILGEFDSHLMRFARNIVLSHHEKWDGTGYPKGLRGDDIPIEGRICAISDVFDALRSVRPYKPAWPEDEAIKFINDNSGTHFDPVLVDIFNQVIPEIQNIRDIYDDETRKN